MRIRPDHTPALSLSRLQFALVVLACGVIAALALEGVAQLQVRGDAAQHALQQAQARAGAALAQARCGAAATPDATTDFPTDRRAPAGNPSGSFPSCP